MLTPFKHYKFFVFNISRNYFKAKNAKNRT